MIHMNDMTLHNVYEWVGRRRAVTLFGRGDTKITGVCTDSRHIKSGELFIAIVGESMDGHDFLTQVQSIAAAVVVDRFVPGLKIPALVVADTREALGEISLGYREQFSLPLVCVAGSNGKTTVKEMLAAIFARAVGADKRLSTQGNLNNDLGVPFTLFRLTNEHQLGVIEIGMNHPGEIAWIASLVKPKVAFVNNAQREHQEFMATVEATAVENGASISTLPDDGIAIFPFDDKCRNIWRELSAKRTRIEFGLVPDTNANLAADDTVSYVYASANSQTDQFDIYYRTKNSVQSARIGVRIDGQHNVKNALGAAACALALGINLDVIAQGLADFEPAKGRLVRHTLRSGACLIDDSYNANPDSVRAAISILATVSAPRVLVLGDMGEVGSNGPQFHQEIGEFAKLQGLEHLLLLGEATKDTAVAAGGIAEHFNDVDTLIQRAASLVNQGTPTHATVLVKGSRFMKMERVVKALTEVEMVIANTHSKESQHVA
jgi:UDP-N-acetylmuramoyl-tripeptide--D-alanyl-D-alanine ligase